MVWKRMIFFRFLQVRHSFDKKLKGKLVTGDPGLMETFLTLIKPRSDNKMFSKLYNAILTSKQENTEYIKKKWEKEIQIEITQDNWEKICKLHWVTTGSNTWR